MAVPACIWIVKIPYYDKPISLVFCNYIMLICCIFQFCSLINITHVSFICSFDSGNNSLLHIFCCWCQKYWFCKHFNKIWQWSLVRVHLCNPSNIYNLFQREHMVVAEGVGIILENNLKDFPWKVKVFSVMYYCKLWFTTEQIVISQSPSMSCQFTMKREDWLKWHLFNVNIFLCCSTYTKCACPSLVEEHNWVSLKVNSRRTYADVEWCSMHGTQRKMRHSLPQAFHLVGGMVE